MQYFVFFTWPWTQIFPMLKHNFKKQLHWQSVVAHTFKTSNRKSALTPNGWHLMFDSPVTTRCLNLLKAQILKNQFLKPLSNRQSQNVILNSKQWLDISRTLFTCPPTGFLYNSPDCVAHSLASNSLPLPRMPLGLKQWATTTHGPYIFEGPVRCTDTWVLSTGPTQRKDLKLSWPKHQCRSKHAINKL